MNDLDVLKKTVIIQKKCQKKKKKIYNYLEPS